MTEVHRTNSCSRGYPWCANEETRASADGSPARFHLGASTTVDAGDDVVACALVASEDLHSELYLEVGLESRGRRRGSVWLSMGEASALGAWISASAELGAEHL